jgi:hypothetical protein
VGDVRPGGVQLVDRLVAGELGGVALPTRLPRSLLPGEGRQFHGGQVGRRFGRGVGQGAGDVTEHGALVEQELLERLAEIVQQVPAVDDLPGGGCPARRRVGVEAAAIACDRGDAGVLLEPGRDLVGVAVRQQVEGPPALQIDDDGAEAATAAPGELVHAHGLGLRAGRQRRGADETEERRPADRQSQGGCQVGTGGPAERQPDPSQRVAQPVGPPRVAVHELRQLLGKDALRAGGVTADKPTHAHPEPDRCAAPREVGDGAVVAAVDPMRTMPARWARRGPARGEELEGDPLVGDGDFGETQPFQMGQERGKTHPTTPSSGDDSQTGKHSASAQERPGAIIERRQEPRGL